MKTAQIAVALLFAGLFVIATYAFAAGDFFAEGWRIVAMPWGIATLADIYTGFLLFCGWVLYRERSPATALPWMIGVLVIGNLVSALYVLFALHTSGDWKRFWMGAKA